MLTPDYTTQFRKDYKLCQRRSMKMKKLQEVMGNIESETLLTPAQRPHSLTGNYIGHTECHIEPDWLLIYKVDKKAARVVFVRTGSHSDLY